MNPAGWQPDPFGRHQHRYWDGTAWTAHVADHGVTGTDAPIPTPVPPAPAAPAAQTAPAAPARPSAVSLPTVLPYPTSEADARDCRLFRRQRHWRNAWFMPEFDEHGAVITSHRETQRGEVIELPVASITEQLILTAPPDPVVCKVEQSEPGTNCRLMLTDLRLILLSAPPAVRMKGFKKLANAVGTVAWAVGSIGELNLGDLVEGKPGAIRTTAVDGVIAASIPLLQIDGLNFGKSSVSIVMSYRWGSSRGFPVQSWIVPIDEANRERTLEFFDDVWARMQAIKREVLRPQLHEGNQEKFDSFAADVHAPGATRMSPFTPIAFGSYGKPRFLSDMPFARDGFIEPIPSLDACRFGGLSDDELLVLRSIYGRHFLAATAALREAGVTGLPTREYEGLAELCRGLQAGAIPKLAIPTMLKEFGGTALA